VRARVAALPAEARRLLELAAVAGVPLPREALTESAAIEQTTADAMVDLLRAQRLAKGLGPAQGGSVDVHHDRIREIVAQALPDDERRRCHRRLAETLERREDTKAEVVAGHLEGAGEPERAARFWLTAADEALRALAFGHAARLYQRGLAHARLSPEEAHPIALRRAGALAYAGKGAEAARLYRDEAERASADEAIELRRRAAEQLLITGHLDEGLSVIEDVLRAIGMKGTRSGRRALLSIVGGRIRVGARGLRHVARPESAIPKAELVRLDASWTIACSLGTLDFIRGAEFQNRHILLALRAGEPRRVLRALTLEAAYAAAPGAGSARRSARLVRVAEDLARRIDEDGAFELLCLSRGLVHYLQGRIGDALPHFEEALAALARRSGGAIWETVTAQRFTISSLFFLGRLRRLQAFVPPLLAEAEANGNLYATMCFRASYGTLAWLSRDDVAGAWAELDKARADWQSPLFQLSQCNILIGESFADFYVGDFERAFTRLYEAWPNILAAQLHRISILRAQLHYLRAAADVGMADVLEARGDAAKAEVLRQDARVLAGKRRRDAVRRAPAWGGLIEAALAERAGNLPLARMALDEAAKAFAEQGMKLFAAAARARRRGLDAALTEEDYAPFREEGVVNPVAMLDLVAPGFRARAVTPPPA
jgi:eukaryotic-like serine/threonine-protein kinase